MKITHKRTQTIALICGIFGCVCFGAGDWLMMYGNPAYRSQCSAYSSESGKST